MEIKKSKRNRRENLRVKTQQSAETVHTSDANQQYKTRIYLQYSSATVNLLFANLQRHDGRFVLRLQE